MSDNPQIGQFLNADEPPLRAIIRDRLVLLQLMQDGLTPRHLLVLERLAESKRV